jgi:hypothetical protein
VICISVRLYSDKHLVFLCLSLIPLEEHRSCPFALLTIFILTQTMSREHNVDNNYIDLSGSLPPHSKFVSIVCQARMISAGDNEIYTGLGLRGVIPYVQSQAVVFPC